MDSEDFLSLEVHSPGGLKEKIDGIESLNIRLDDGSLLGIRPGHAPLIATAVRSVLNYTVDGRQKALNIDAGFVTVDHDTVKILTTA